MGFWSDTFGGGNSFTESVANTFTPTDGASYVSGNLVYDSGAKKGQVVQKNEGGGYGGTDKKTGKSTYSGSGQSDSTGHVVSSGDTLSEIAAKTGTSVEQLMALNNITDPKKLQVGTALKTSGATSFFKDGLSIFDNKSDTGIKGQAPSGFGKAMGFASGTGIIGALSGWANNLDPEKDISRDGAGVFDGRQVYVNENGMKYSYNFAGLQYEVEVVDGKVQDALSKDANGNFPTDPNYDRSTSGYQKMSDEQRSQGNDDKADQIMQEAADNANTGGDDSDDSTNVDDIAQSVLDMAEAAGLISSQDEKNAILADPMKFLEDRGLKLSDVVPSLDANTDGAQIGDMEEMADISPEVSTVDNVATVDNVTGEPISTYDAATNTITDDMKVDAVTGEIDNDNLVNAEDYVIDTEAISEGKGPLGKALNDFASQNISSIIDTSTADGKLLAQALGEGNYTDSKATVLGQAKLIAAEFKDSNGNARIPAWAQGVARDVSKTMTFGGLSGTAATESMANAIMEATLGVADKDAKFYQTITLKNLDNRQQAILNKAKTIATVDLANMKAHEVAAVQDAKAFLQMDLSNLTNQQQAEVINKQIMKDALFTNTAAENAARLFASQESNDAAEFYANMNVAIDRDNANTINTLAKFNAGEINDNREYVAELRNNREQFTAKQQFFIDKYNGDWIQKVATTNTQMNFDAASFDVKAALGISQEAQNRLWDDADNILDYIWKSSDNDMQREYLLLAAQIQSQSGKTSSGNSFLQSALQIGGAVLGAGSKPWWLA
jgi:LysM repeat protein